MPRRRSAAPALLQALVAGLLSLVLATPAAAGPNDVQLTAKLGWDGPLRSGRWVPLHVTAFDPAATDARPRAVRIDLEIPQGGPNVMQLRQFATIGPAPSTFTLVIPFRYQGYGNDGGPSVTLRDAASQRTLARWPDEQLRDGGPGGLWERLSDADKQLVGVVGEWSLLEALESGSGARMQTVPIPGDRLPTQPLGYDLLDLLVLNRANVNRLGQDAQQAIADWVRGGGTILMWPGNDPIPPGPLADVLPCKVGRPVGYPITASRRAALTLADRFTQMQGFELTPTPDATPVELWPGEGGDAAAAPGRSSGRAVPAAVAYTQRVGFGRVTVAPFDVSRFEFQSTSAGVAFYTKLTDRLGLLSPPDPPADGRRGPWNYNNYTHGADALTRQLDAATSTLQDRLGDVPGAGRFGFSYVAWVVLGMMVLVGPVDWFVLKRLGRQPWTWVTTAGWIGLITVGALSVAQVFKSGDLHFNTVQMIDQADDRVVGRTSLVGLYSPQTTTYHLDAAAAPPPAGDAGVPPVPSGAGSAKPTPLPPPGWWSVAAGGGGRPGGGLSLDTPFHQTADANAPDPGGFVVNVWNLRFLRGETVADGGDPLIKAHLRLVTAADGSRTVEGTIRNVGDRPLTDLRVVVGGQFARPADATAPADVPNRARRAGTPAVASPTPSTGATGDAASVELAPQPSTDDTGDDSRQESNLAAVERAVVLPRIPPGEAATLKAPVPPKTFVDRVLVPIEAGPWAAAGRLAPRRALRVALEREGHTPDVAVVYATVVDPRPPAALREPPTRQKHEAYLRAIVRLQR